MGKGKVLAVVISSVAAVFFLISTILSGYNIYHNFVFPEHFTHNLLLAQSVMFFMAACSVIIFIASSAAKNARGRDSGIIKIVLLNEDNAPGAEYGLLNRTSVLLGRDEASNISLSTENVAIEYAVINMVNNVRYLERLADDLNVGIKRAGDQFIYKLKSGKSYILQKNDVIFIDNERLMMI